MSSYSMTVPSDDLEAIRAAAEFFAARCGCLVEPRPVRDGAIIYSAVDGKALDASGAPVTPPPLPVAPTPTPPSAVDAFKAANGALAAFGKAVEDATPPPAAQTPIEAYRAAVSEGDEEPDPVKIFEQPLPPPSTIALADGIPWDERIHSSSRNTLKGAPHGWKLKKQPSEYPTREAWLSYVAEVEAELRAAIAAGGANATARAKQTR